MEHPEIVVFSDNQTVLFAANELAGAMARATGMTPGIVRAVTPDPVPTGATKRRLTVGTWSDLRRDTETPASGGNSCGERILIDVDYDRGITGLVSGDTPRAVLLAAYRLLHGLGWRWPDPYTERIPSIDSISRACPIYLEFAASYRHRGICIEGSVSEEHVKAIIDWAPRAGFNGYFIQFREGHTFFDRWYSERENRHLSRTDAEAIVERIVPEIEKRGLDYHAVGHGWTCEPFGVPGLGWERHEGSIPRDASSSFAQINGVRELWDGIALNTNLCYSSRRVRETMAAAVADYAAAHREIDYLHVWLADGANNQCECDACREQRPSDFYVRILNRIDELLTAYGLDTRIVFLAYVDLFWPPESETLHNPDRFVLMFAPITRSYSSSFMTEKPIPDTTPYVRNRLVFPKSVEGNLAYLKAWQKLFTGDSFDFDYHMMWDHYTDPGYTHMARIIHEDVGHLNRIGLGGYMSCQVQRSFFPTGLCMYVLGASLWNTDRSFEEISDEYFAAAYGAIGRRVFDYLADISRLASPEHLRNERIDEPEAVIRRMHELKAHLKNHDDLRQSIEGIEGTVLTRHAELLEMVADALILRAQSRDEEAVKRWNEAAGFTMGLEPEILDRFDDYMYRRVIGGRLFGVKY